MMVAEGDLMWAGRGVFPTVVPLRSSIPWQKSEIKR